MIAVRNKLEINRETQPGRLPGEKFEKESVILGRLPGSLT